MWTEKELLERAAEVAGKAYIDPVIRPHNERGVAIIRWNPITSKADRYELLEAMEALIDFDECLVEVPIPLRREWGYEMEHFKFSREDASQAQAVLEAANVVWKSRHDSK